ncbi:hypothetical protein MCOR27_001375 [Pyricularia oryzae]|uniref:Glycosyltransferase family 32 protein n=1 Tax=Pyricularia grisea TaxID=148305 RepID=A0ABQ8NN26_PYRGI|nr:hypothetical protein MCOR01_007981 [Pyricularia oryzae]KAI6299540.1 hypothetical protein MCOR33_004555 [Pyricularia grisea]KAI6259698.1 hypothetical protein MCOR19_003946 [Pyricularia oryzae]KAI6283329.1 hypothetical protein MCOR26_002433 [Pyricularia oryzae]KAI6287474.1 hypothetical protein MCOR27_001375 [Pyricularia oryzae]
MFSRRSKFSLASAFFLASFLFLFIHTYRYGSPEKAGLGGLLSRPFGGEAKAPRPQGTKDKDDNGIPKKLWFKLGPKGLDDNTRAWSDSCIKANPTYKVSFMNDATADKWVEENFGKTHPDLVELYQALTVPIFKADILRYLFLFVEGGVYLDLDVSCDRPIEEWIPAQHKGKVSVVAGWEFDVGWGDNFVRQFATWTIMAKPNLPHIWNVVHDIEKTMRDKVREKNLDSPANLTMALLGDVVDVTGPRRFTRSVLDNLERSGDKPADMTPYEKLLEPKLLGDLLIMPGWAFAASSNTYDESFPKPPPMVTHHYAGSWKNDKGGETL